MIFLLESIILVILSVTPKFDLKLFPGYFPGYYAHCFAMHRTSLAFRKHKFINETAAKLNSDSNLKIIIPGTPCWNGLFIIRVTENQSEVIFLNKN